MLEKSAKTIVSLAGVSKIYPSQKGEVYAVRDVTLAVQAGEFYSLLGSSGSGKTTTLRLIGGFEIPEYGQVFLGGGGDNPTALPPGCPYGFSKICSLSPDEGSPEHWLPALCD